MPAERQQIHVRWDSDSRSRAIAMHDDPRFRDLKRRLIGFAFPMGIAFFVWYLLYVILSAYARDLMATQIVGHVNVALVFGLLQFASTFGIAIYYSRFAERRLDPMADELHDEIVTGQKAQGGRS